MPEWPPTPAACSYSCFPGTASTSSYLFLDLIAQSITFTGAASISHDVKAQSIITCHTTSSHPSYAFAQKGRAKFSSLVFPVPCCPCPFQFILASCLLFFPFHVAPCSLLFLPSHVPQLLFAFLSMSCPPPLPPISLASCPVSSLLIYYSLPTGAVFLTSKCPHQAVCGSCNRSRGHKDSHCGCNVGGGAVQEEGVQPQLEQQLGQVMHINSPQQQKHEGHFGLQGFVAGPQVGPRKA